MSNLVKCPKCGEVLTGKEIICPTCGEPVSKSETKNTSSKKPSSNMIIAVIAVVVIIAIVGVFVSGMLSGDASTADNTKQNDTVDPIVENDDSSSSNTSEYWASAKAEKFHLPTCEWAEKISDDNKIIYHSRDDAIEDGKVPCGACNP